MILEKRNKSYGLAEMMVNTAKAGKQQKLDDISGF
jgi:hypothetical protein